MAHGKTKGKVDGKFAQRIQDLEKKAEKAKDMFRNHNNYREWWTPDGVKDPLDVPSLHNPNWDRNSINQLYSDSILTSHGEGSGTVGDLIAMKWQADFMAVEERAFRTRHASMIRCAALTHGRIEGHSKPEKSIFSFLKDSVDQAIKHGAATG
jgi:hypothetical protein